MELVKFLFAALKLSLNLRQKVRLPVFPLFSGMLCVSDDVVENVSVLRAGKWKLFNLEPTLARILIKIFMNLSFKREKPRKAAGRRAREYLD